MFSTGYPILIEQNENKYSVFDNLCYIVTMWNSLPYYVYMKREARSPIQVAM